MRRMVSLKSKIKVGFFTALTVLIVIAALSYGSTLTLLNTVNDEARAHEIITSLNAVLANLNAAEGSHRGYLITGDTSHMARYRGSITSVHTEQSQLQQLTRGSDVSAQVSVFDQLVRRRVGEFRERQALRDQYGLEAAAAAIRADTDDADIYRQAAEIESQVRRHLATQQTTAARVGRITLSVSMLGGLTAALFMMIAGSIILREVSARTTAFQSLYDREQRLNDVLDNTGEIIHTIDRNGLFTYVNRAWRDTLGYSASDLATLYARSIVDPAHQAHVDEVVRRVIRGRTQEPLETVFVTKTGEKVLVAGNISAREGADQVLRVRGMFRDVTEERAVERLKDEFVSVVSHELRTPLTSIRGALGLIASGKLGTLDPKGQRMVQIAVTDSERLVRLINDILDIERMESGRVDLQKTSVSLADLITRAAESVGPLADKANVTLEAHAVSGNVWCDIDRVQQTLTNLLGNAIKFSPSGGTVWLTADRDENSVTFRVRDEGRGIPAEKLEQIFERFQQVDASDARSKGGAGLGLAIARSIVIQHGGNIWAESDGQSGSTFVFTLPAYNAPAGRVVGPENGPLVLVAEDDASTAEVLQSMLASNGFRAALASNGRQAVELARQFRPDAILLDIMMPEQDGWETLRQLKQDEITKDIPVIIETGTEQPAHRIAEAPVRDWLKKPLHEDDVIAALRRAVEPAAERPALIVTRFPRG
jgi:PAS domain S-box-containing protein